MPLQFAIEEVVPKEGVGKDYTRWRNSTLVYHHVPQAVAEADSQNGYFSLTNQSGEQISPWMQLETQRLQEATRTAKKSTGPLHKDILGHEIEVGDYVAFSTSSKSAGLGIGKVISYSPKKVQVVIYDRWCRASQKDPSGLIRIQPGLI